MALGSVSISTFIPGRLEDLTGTVSIIPFTRAEIERLANKKAYPMVSWYGPLTSMHRLLPMFLMTWTISRFQLATPLLK